MSNLSFEVWLATLSLDASHSDLCPNLAYIPIRQLRRLWREDCPPGAEAISAHQWKGRLPRPQRSPLAKASLNELLEEASRRGMVVELVAPDALAARLTREMAGRGHNDEARLSTARSDQDQEMDRRAVDQDERRRRDDGKKPRKSDDDSPENGGGG
jgi:hypothetical protein